MYRFQLERTLEDYNALSRVYAKTTYKRAVLIRRTLYGVSAAFFLLLGAGNCYLKRWVFAAIYMSMALFFVVSNLFWHPLVARRMWRHASKDLGTITVWLEESGIRTKHAKEESLSPYEAYDGVYYYRERYFLTSGGEIGALPEHSLVEGDPATLKAFLADKLQKEVQEIP